MTSLNSFEVSMSQRRKSAEEFSGTWVNPQTAQDSKLPQDTLNRIF